MPGDTLARAGELVADVYRALTIMDPVPPDDAEYMAVTEIARAGLALRAALGSMHTNSFNAALAYDARVRAAVGADAGAVAGEAGT